MVDTENCGCESSAEDGESSLKDVWKAVWGAPKWDWKGDAGYADWGDISSGRAVRGVSGLGVRGDFGGAKYAESSPSWLNEVDNGEDAEKFE